jgi:hypothetical protein
MLAICRLGGGIDALQYSDCNKKEENTFFDLIFKVIDELFPNTEGECKEGNEACELSLT